jgi:hypothetical protein
VPLPDLNVQGGRELNWDEYRVAMLRGRNPRPKAENRIDSEGAKERRPNPSLAPLPRSAIVEVVRKPRGCFYRGLHGLLGFPLSVASVQSVVNSGLGGGFAALCLRVFAAKPTLARFRLRSSGLGFRISFGFRASDFGFGSGLGFRFSDLHYGKRFHKSTPAAPG